MNKENSVDERERAESARKGQNEERKYGRKGIANQRQARDSGMLIQYS